MGRRLLHYLLEEKQTGRKGGLYHQTQIKLAFNSNRIEGSRLSEEQTRFIYETNTLDFQAHELVNVDDILETVNHFACFDLLLERTDHELTEDLIKEFHYLLKQNTEAHRKKLFLVGDYKALPNMVGDTKTTPPDKVVPEIRALLRRYDAITKPTFANIVDFHYSFELIHPFQDGNGRVGRLIMFKECLKNDILPFIIDHEHKLFYYRGLREYPKEKGYLLDTCLSSQDRYKEQVAYFYPDFPL